VPTNADTILAMTSISASSAAANAARHPTHEQVDPRFAGRRIHFIGIGGCGMSGLAFMLKRLGALCEGSDSTAGDLTEALTADGIPVRFDQSSGTIPDSCDLVIASAAIKPDHPELLTAVNRGIHIWTYAEALGHVQAAHTGISLAGTHGKSTTTAMLAHVLIQCGFDPSFIVGATCHQIGGGSRTGGASIPKGALAGSPGILIAEACEFNRSFHHHRPRIGLINNLEEDHLDIYGSLEEIIHAFAGFAQLIPQADVGGKLLIAHEGAQRMQITPGLKCAVETFGFHPEADYQVVFDQAVQRVGVMQDGVWLAHWTTKMPGAHNALNSSAAGILASWFGADWEEIAAALDAFSGLDRRMQKLGVRKVSGGGGGEVTVYDDYGHHPTEIENTLRALRAAENPTRLICVFQPHQHSRTRFLMEQFAQSFSSADVVIVPHIYFVRDSEVEKSKVSATDLVDRLRQRGVHALHMHPFEAIVEHLETICRGGDLVVIMGAGPVWKVGKAFFDQGKK
jgi:UDP-N-acetylmuramate--alanine ligase